MSTTSKRLREGVRRFQQEVFTEHRELFESLATKQFPKVLIIACSDSRVDPQRLTGSLPGDIFVERNPGALVPVYSLQAVGVSASIEYAVQVLGIRHIVVASHSDCGAMKATLHPEKAKGVPAVQRWLSFAKPAVQRLTERERQAKPPKLLESLTKHCVCVQMEHLMSHPSVRAATESGGIKIVGAYYDIATGRVSRVLPKRT